VVTIDADWRNLVIELGHLEKISNLREVWDNESGDFTPWLAREENLKLLGDTIGIDLVLEAQEKNVGFRADILCKDTITNDWVLIENQIEKTDHTHLGQILTYGAGLEATTIVWIAKRFTEEHRATLDWLNEITDERFNFFGLEIELWRIGNSPIAPKFNVICKPNDWSRTQYNIAKEFTSEEQLLLEYWTNFVEFLREHDSSLKNAKPKPFDHILFLIVGKWQVLSALAYIKDNKIGVQVYLKGSNAKTYFEQLQRETNAIENIIGAKLEWNDSRTKERSIDLFMNGVNIKNRENWPDQHKWLYEKLKAFYGAFAGRVKNLIASDYQQEDTINLKDEGSQDT
jgi:hypothetical protein